MRRRDKWIIVLLVCAVMLAGVGIYAISALRNPFRGAAARYYQSLLDEGFPASYAKPLTELHLEHPLWVFSPLFITEQNETLTWSYVLENETATPGISVVSASDRYRAYRHSGGEQPEPGYFRASEEAVAYFLDPRNALNETDVFQFADLSRGGHSTSDGLYQVLKGTFLEDLTLENGVPCPDYLLSVGEEIGIDPVYVAVRIRQEMGVGGTSPVISGVCGTLLAYYYTEQTRLTSDGRSIAPPEPGSRDASELLAYDGLYNFFNLGASGTGIFSIYEGAMKRAASGTEAMRSKWDGSPVWNTRWKAIWGGSWSLCHNYIGIGQYTLYLQKFDVNRGAGETAFSHQYMTNLAAPRTEARSLYASYESAGALDSACVFRIPVYAGMPRSACTDPGSSPSSLASAGRGQGQAIPHILLIPDERQTSLSSRNSDRSRKELL